MKKHFTLLVLLFISIHAFTQEIYKEYSYTEFFEMIEQELDSVFKLKNALIYFNPETDQKFSFDPDWETLTSGRSDTLIIDKALLLDRVNFKNSLRDNKTSTGLHLINFKKPVTIINSFTFFFRSCTFQEKFQISGDDFSKESYRNFKNHSQQGFNYTLLIDNHFLDGIYINIGANDLNDDALYMTQLQFYRNIISSKKKIKSPYSHDYINISNLQTFVFEGNNYQGELVAYFNLNKPNNVDITQNNFDETILFLNLSEISEKHNINIRNNLFKNYSFLNVEPPKHKHSLDWHQFNQKVIHEYSYRFNFQSALRSRNPEIDFFKESALKQAYFEEYFNTYRIENEETFREETKLRFGLYNLYRAQGNVDNANSIYIDAKNLQTQRQRYLYKENPNFKSFFTWKINQFLKVFSAYGTEPSRAVVYSMRVILFFALIYLFFPNSWDKHGKNRIIDRYSFFFTYMNKKAGIHEVYLDEQKEELMSYDQFKNNITNSEQKVPKFFTATALPLYKWAISGTKLSAAFLKRIDIMKGTWSDLPARKRFWKSILLVGAFLITVLYDIFIKMLNALMLSINTFTTLGFGEIPIKGLPRYLAIIQGFIGWFMLTIFSVSLISQLLN